MPPVKTDSPETSSADLRLALGRFTAEISTIAAELHERDVRAEAEREAVECELPTRDGRFRLLAHERSAIDLTAALVHGDPATHPAPVVRAHEACLFGDVFGSLACDCGERLRAAEQEILAAGAGVLLYTKRFTADAFLCAAGQGPDRAIGAGLLDRLGVGESRPAPAA